MIVDEEPEDKREREKNEKMLTTLTYSFSRSRLSRFPPPSLFVYKIIVFIEVREALEKCDYRKQRQKREKKMDQLELLLRCYLNGNKSTSLNYVCSASLFFFPP
jgi:hypothetical protein